MERLHKRTMQDLKRLKEIDSLVEELYTEYKLIKEQCPCLDLEPGLVETFSFEYTPRAICPVCGATKDILTQEQKIACFKENFSKYDFTEDDYMCMAIDGGYTFQH